MVGAALFGALHALMPGHGKTVLVSYHLGRPAKTIEGLLNGTILIVMPGFLLLWSVPFVLALARQRSRTEGLLKAFAAS